jgi:AraC family ethanolamine operon transcriptional activator
MEEEIMATVSRAIETSDAAELIHTGRPRFPRGRVVAKALELIRENEGQPLHVQDLCRATQVSERTLRNIFQEYFGVGPMRLLKVNQLSEIRSALIAADPDTQTISSIVTRFGVWDFSSFARNYKALYRETASQTLRRPATHSREDALHPTWIRFAARKFSEYPQ